MRAGWWLISCLLFPALLEDKKRKEREKRATAVPGFETAFPE